MSNDPDNLLFFVDDFERTTRKTKKKRRLVVSTRVVFVANVRVLVERHIPKPNSLFSRASWAKIVKEEDSFLEERTPTKKTHKNRKKEFDLRV